MPLIRDTKPYGAPEYKPKSVTPAPKQAAPKQTASQIAPSSTPPKPYGALAMDDNGLPFYGDGFKGWVRKTWADLTDPDKYLQDIRKLDDVQQTYFKTEYEANVKAAGQAVEKSKWGTWAEDFFGLTSEEIGRQKVNVATELKIAEEVRKTGTVLDSKALTMAGRAVRLGVDTSQNLLWGGLEILSLDDTAMRKINSTIAGIDAVADRFNKDTQDTWLKKLFSGGSVAVAKDLFTIAGAVQQGRMSWGEVWSETGKYRAASDMAYSMIWDEYAKAEFEKGIAEGKDPALLAQSLGKAGIELTGSILGSPGTYLGLKLIAPVSIPKWLAGQAGDVVTIFSKTHNVPWRTVARIPTFGDALYKFSGGAVKVGHAYRVEKGLATLSDMPEGLEKLFLKEAGKLKDEKGLSRVLKLMAEETTKLFDDATRAKGYTAFSLDSRGKSEVIGRHANLMIRAVIGELSGGRIDNAVQILRDMALAYKGGPEAVEAAGRLWSTGQGKMLFSSTGRITGEILARLSDEGIEALVKAHKGDPLTLAAKLTKQLGDIVDDLVPSVDDMYAAVLKVATDKVAGIVTDEKTLRFSEMYKDVPWLIRQVTKATRIPEAVSGATSKTMAFSFMHLTPRAFARNIEGQGLLTALHVGFGTALEASITSLAGLIPALTRNIATSKEALLIERTGMISSTAAQGIGKMVPREFKILGIKIPGLLPSMGRSEQLYGAEIILKKSSDYIIQQLPNVVRDLPEWDSVISKLDADKKGLLFAAMNRSYGNFDKGIETFRNWFKDGEIKVRQIVEPNAYLRRELDEMMLMDKFYDLQQSATKDEFLSALGKFTKDYEKGVLDKAKKMPWLANAGDELSDLMRVLEKSGDKETQNMMNGVIQSWHNVKNQVDNLVNSVFEMMDTRVASEEFDALKRADINKRLAPIKQMAYRAKGELAYENVDKLRREINIVSDALKSDEITIDLMTKIWNEPFKGINGVEMFTLSKQYPDISVDSLTAAKLRKLMWPAFFEHKATKWYTLNSNAYDNVLKNLDDGARLFGSSIEEMASSLNSEENLFKLAGRMKLEAYEIEQMYAFKRMFKNLNVSDDISLDEAIAQYKKTFPDWTGDAEFVKGDTLWDAKKFIKEKIMVSPYAGTLPTAERAKYEGLPEFLRDVKGWQDEVLKNWDVTVPTPSLDIEKELRALKPAFEKRMSTIRVEAMATGEGYRNFLLHDYNKTYADHALTYLLGNSFHYWTTRTYRNALETLIGDPKWANAFLSLKDYNQKRHSELPEWLRNNLVIQGDGNNQYFINLESMINPVYGLTGVDFNDPHKRVDAVSRLVDDGNKLGPTFSPLISWAVAIALYNKGEQEASERWFGRMLPQSAPFKGLTNKLFKKPIETDPFALMMEGNMTPYERNRVVAAMGFMVQNKVKNPETGQPITEEEMIDAFRKKEGQLWNVAVSTSLSKRFLGEASSFFLGGAMRVRTQEDVVIDQFWKRYSLLVTSRNMMSSDDYRMGFDKLREDFKFADGMLISRKAGDEQLSALAYNVMARIEPGQSSVMAELVGIKPYMLEAFYDNKGDFDRMGLNPQDKARFESGIIDLSILLAMPDGATREEWTMAKSEYSKLVEQMNKKFGIDIQKKMSDFFDVKQSQRDVYLQKNPEVNLAFNFKNEYIVSKPILTAYYGGLDVLTRYYDNQVYNVLDVEFKDMDEKFSKYKELQITNPKLAYKFKGMYLNPYYDMQEKLYKEADKMILKAAPNIPVTMPYTIRPQFQPLSEIQEGVRQEVQTQGPTWADWQEVLSPALQKEIMDTIQSGGTLKYSAQTQLKDVAEKEFGISGYAALRQIQLLLRQK